VDRQHRVEQVCKPDAVRFGHEPEERPVAVETPRASRLHEGKTTLVVPEENFLPDPTIRASVNDGEGVRSMPLDADDGGCGVGQQTADYRIRLEFFELHCRGVAPDDSGHLLRGSKLMHPPDRQASVGKATHTANTGQGARPWAAEYRVHRPPGRLSGVQPVTVIPLPPRHAGSLVSAARPARTAGAFRQRTRPTVMQQRLRLPQEIRSDLLNGRGA
jgi:hypothetical protein